MSKSFDAEQSRYKNRKVATVGRDLAESPHFALAQRLERYAEMRCWKHQDQDMFSAAGGDPELGRLRGECERGALALVMGAIRFDRERGIVCDASQITRFAAAVLGLDGFRRNGAKFPLHRAILDLMESKTKTLGELIDALVKRGVVLSDTDELRRVIRRDVKELGLTLKGGKRGRPKSAHLEA
jgi:hypothetical protein